MLLGNEVPQPLGRSRINPNKPKRVPRTIRFTTTCTTSIASTTQPRSTYTMHGTRSKATNTRSGRKRSSPSARKRATSSADAGAARAKKHKSKEGSDDEGEGQKGREGGGGRGEGESVVKVIRGKGKKNR